MIVPTWLPLSFYSFTVLSGGLRQFHFHQIHACRSARIKRLSNVIPLMWPGAEPGFLERISR